MMLVWRLRDTYKAIFEIDSEAMATSVDENGKVNPVSNIMMAFERFVRIQGDAALRHVAGQYAYDNTDDDKTAQTLRDNSEEINKLLEQTLDERLDMAGIEIIEARIKLFGIRSRDSSRNVASPTSLCHNLCPRKNSGRSSFYGRHGTEKTRQRERCGFRRR